MIGFSLGLLAIAVAFSMTNGPRSGLRRAYIAWILRAAALFTIFVSILWAINGVPSTAVIDYRSITPYGGHSYYVAMTDLPVPGDTNAHLAWSELSVFENGRPLNPPHTNHSLIASKGAGAYSHWHDTLIFSASDNSDPRNNSRTYSVSYRWRPGSEIWFAAAIAIWFLSSLAPAKTERPWDARYYRYLLSALFAAVLVAVTIELSLRFGLISNAEVPQAGSEGSTSAPSADAALWSNAGLQFLLEGYNTTVPWFLYRPVIGIFFGSILAAFSAIEAVPVFFFAILILTSIWSLVALTNRASVAVMLWLASSAAAPYGTLWAAYVTLPMPDLPALFFTLVGWLFVAAFLSGFANRAMLLAGLLFLGQATAIRGLMLLAGPVALMLCCWKERWKKWPFTVATGLTLFAAPIFIDHVARVHYHTANNAAAAIWCVATDSSHFWSASCDEAFQAQRPTTHEVLVRYFVFISSSEGLSYFANAFSHRLQTDLQDLESPAFIAILFVGLVFRIVTEYRAQEPTVLDRATKSVFEFILICILFSLDNWLFPGFVLIAFCIMLALKRTDWVSLSCFGVYLSGLVMLILVGAAGTSGLGSDRYSATYSFALANGLLLILLRHEPNFKLMPERWPLLLKRGLVPASLGLLCFLYLSVWVWPSDWRTRYWAEVRGHNAALKVFDDRRLNRSGYFIQAPLSLRSNFSAIMFYTAHDNLPVGSIKHYRALESAAFFVDSFRNPNAFINELPSRSNDRLR